MFLKQSNVKQTKTNKQDSALLGDPILIHYDFTTVTISVVNTLFWWKLWLFIVKYCEGADHELTRRVST